MEKILRRRTNVRPSINNYILNKCLTLRSHEAETLENRLFFYFGGGGESTECFILDSREAMFRTLDDSWFWRLILTLEFDAWWTSFTNKWTDERTNGRTTLSLESRLKTCLTSFKSELDGWTTSLSIKSLLWWSISMVLKEQFLWVYS